MLWVFTDIMDFYPPPNDLGNLWMDLFHIAHTHPSGGVYVPFEVDEIWPT